MNRAYRNALTDRIKARCKKIFKNWGNTEAGESQALAHPAYVNLFAVKVIASPSIA